MKKVAFSALPISTLMTARVSAEYVQDVFNLSLQSTFQSKHGDAARHLHNVLNTKVLANLSLLTRLCARSTHQQPGLTEAAYMREAGIPGDDNANAHDDYVANRLRLKPSVGTVNINDLVQINTWLGT